MCNYIKIIFSTLSLLFSPEWKCPMADFLCFTHSPQIVYGGAKYRHIRAFRKKWKLCFPQENCLQMHEAEILTCPCSLLEAILNL